jgi:HlyD family secretion protein
MAGKKKKRGKLIFIAAFVLLLIASGAFAAWKKREQPISVQLEPVALRTITELVVANGRIHPVVQVVINPEVSGEIIELPVKEGQDVRRGDLLVRIKPDNYIASTNLAHAAHQAALSSGQVAQANLEKAELDFRRSERLFGASLISDAEFQSARTSLEVAKAHQQSSIHQAKQAKAALDRALDDLSKTTILSPLTGTITRLKSQIGERVVGSITMTGTEIMTIANLDEMEARVEIGETDIVLIEAGQKARLEVDAFTQQKFSGMVTDIANSARSLNPGNPGQQQEATRFEVKIRIHEKERFRPGMSVTAEVETRSRTNVCAVPIQSVTTRLPKGDSPSRGGTGATEALAASDASSDSSGASSPSKTAERAKPIEVIFVAENGLAKMLPVKRGISDDAFVEILEGVSEGQQVISGGYRAINRDLESGKPVRVESPDAKKNRPNRERRS